MGGRKGIVLAVWAVALAGAGCAGGGSPTAATSTSAAGTGGGGAGGTATVWLCRPGAPADPCAVPLAATVEAASGATSEQPAPAPAPQRTSFDCFYVYPTVSSEAGANADLTVQPAEIDAAVEQASRFSQVCQVWAPMYRQRTSGDLLKGLAGDPAAAAVAYGSLLSAWRDFLARDSDGRPFVLIGHSQGAAILIQLVRSEIDPSPALRRRLVSAIILGGNVQVPDGDEVGSAFRHIPACTAPSEAGCVIAYSTFPSEPPAGSVFGRPGQGVSLQSGQTAKAGQQVLCTNPASLAGGSGTPLAPYFAAVTGGSATTMPRVTWVEYPGMYAASCESAGGATWLQITHVGPAGDRRPSLKELLGPAWGYHQYDVNVALGDLVADVASQEAAYR